MNASDPVSPNERLRQERIRRNWHQRDLADQLGTTLVTINRWERGSQQPGAYFREKLCALFGKSAEELGFFPQNPHPSDETEAETTGPGESLVSTSSTAFSCLWGVPFSRNPFFTGREELLHHVHAMLRQKQTISLTQSWAISGLGGIGKTQTAIEYAYRHAQDYAAVFWISAETYETILVSMVAIANLLNLSEKQEQDQEKVVAAVIRWFTNHSDWLLILDNVEEPGLVKRFLPPARSGSLLFISHRQSLGLTAQTLDLEQMTIEEGMRFLLHRTRLLDQAAPLDLLAPPDQAFAREIVIAMDGLPLALDQAGAYIEATRCSLSDYLQLFRSSQLRLLDERDAHVDHPLSVTRTFALAFERLEQSNALAKDLLTVCAFLAPKPFLKRFLSKEPRIWDQRLRRWLPIHSSCMPLLKRCSRIRCSSAIPRPKRSRSIAWCKRCSKGASQKRLSERGRYVCCVP